MTITRLKYTGSTPGADANTYVLFSTVAAACPGNWGPMCGFHTFHYDIDNDQAGTLNLYKSSNRGTSWTQMSTTAVAIPAANTSNNGVLLIEGLADFKVEWVNGGSAQTVWAVDMDVSTFP
jgi:hypothetical protein